MSYPLVADIDDLTSAHVLLNLLNELSKRDKMIGLPSISSPFRNKLNIFNKIMQEHEC